jgi:Eco57I restriction-modification methylase
MPTFNQDHLKKFDFKQLFNELGWDKPAQQQPYAVTVGEDSFYLAPVSHKRSVQILHCKPDAQGCIPDYATRQKIERKVTADVREHLIVFTDTAETTQIWQWVSRVQGKTAQYREVVFRQGETPELLTQKLSRLQFTLNEEELLTVFGVTQKLDDAAPREKVTKKFYGEFEKQRKAFAEFIDGIPTDSEDQRWYTAVLIDRLMFLWFLQEKGFLDGKKDYLQSRLAKHLGAAQETSFYKSFLSPLFFRGFAEERTLSNKSAITAEFGDVPYLNGGLFAPHELEQRYGNALDVADDAFTKLFTFFDEWEWHLDERPLKSGKEINPDVLGYIFEKFVNQKQMGAYYTKEDITDYIGKNTIIPCLLAKVRAEHPKVFDDLAWPLLQQSGDAYIYPAMLKGVDSNYPQEIANGLDTDAPDLLARRKPWNKRADDAVSLPTEIWRETIARHQRTREVRAKLAAGELRDVGDLITYNLNIRQFAQDLIERCTDVGLLKSFWFNLAGRLPRKSNEKFRHGLSVLDPTCGSGAFLFAALNILKPLYDATLRTLQAVRSDALIAGEKSRAEKWAEVDELLARFATASSDRAQDYAVIKHIIVNNLYGVDIEQQATEIAKLRLFLKLVALLEPGDDIEPLPDIDFNIRHGNTLVGYATENETEKAVKGAKQVNLFSDAWDDIRIRLTAVEQQYNNFQIQQVQHGGHVSLSDKQALIDTLAELEEMLNYHLAKEYGVNTAKTRDYEAWKISHQPFHWYVDFYPLMASGGFDVVIGNPPYVEMHKLSGYSPRTDLYDTATCGNLYAPITERALQLCKDPIGQLGFIVPLSIFSTERMNSLQKLLMSENHLLVLTHFDVYPSKLFEGAKQRLTIVLCGKKTGHAIFTSKYERWFGEARISLFPQLTLNSTNYSASLRTIEKASNNVHKALLKKLQHFNSGGVLEGKSSPQFYVHRIPYNYVKALNFIPHFSNAVDGEKKSEDYKPYRALNPDFADVVLAILSSNLFFTWWHSCFEGYHCGKHEILAYPFGFDRMKVAVRTELSRLAIQLMNDLKANKNRKQAKYEKTGLVTYDEFFPRKSKQIIDKIDQTLASHYNLSQEELDFVVNYDIKYRMSRGTEDDDD